MIGADAALTLLEQALAAGADDAEALEARLEYIDQSFVRFGCSTILHASRVRVPRVTFRAFAGSQPAEASTTSLHPGALEQACKRAIAVSKASGGVATPTLPSEDGGPTVVTMEGAWHEETAQREPSESSDALGSAFRDAAAAGVELAGRVVSGARELAVVNSLGVKRYFRSTRADAKIFATCGRMSGYSGGVHTQSQALLVDGHAARAIDKCRRSLDPIDVPTGPCDVILEPEAVAELLEWMGYIGFTPRSLENGTSFLAGRLNESVTGSTITLYDDGWCEAGLGIPSPFDGEGTLKKKVMLIEQGVGRGVVHDSRSAARAGCQSTGHAVSNQASFDGSPVPGNLFLEAGEDTAESLLSRVDRGLWVTSLHYVNGMLDPRRAVMTGLTRHGTFWIEDGRLGRGVRNLRFNDSILEALARVDGLTRERRAVPTWWSEAGACVAPTVLIRGLNFVGEISE